MAETLIIIPTYNEKENIERLVSEIFRYAPYVNILVADDDSPDGTGAIADSIAKKDSRVSVMHGLLRRERSIDGLKEALKRQDVRYVMEMDADFTHDPKYIPDFLKDIEHSDIVIGSRFVKAGSDALRGFRRRCLSRAVNYFIRKYLGLKIKDCTSGYRCLRRHVIASLDLDSIVSKGPAILEEILYIANLRKLKIKEMPVVLKKRQDGKTKLDFKKLWKVLMDIVSFKKVHLPEKGKQHLGELRRFGFSFALAMNILGAIMFYRGRGHFIWFTGLGCFNVISAVIFPQLLAPLKRILDNVILLIGRMTNILTSLVVFYLIFTPVSILFKILRKDLLNQKIDKSAHSYWIKVKQKPFSREFYERMG